MWISTIKNHIEKMAWILFLEIAENMYVSALKLVRLEAIPNPGIERWDPSDSIAGLGYPHSVHIP